MAFGGYNFQSENVCVMLSEFLSVSNIARISRVAAADFGPSLALLLAVLITGGWLSGVSIELGRSDGL